MLKIEELVKQCLSYGVREFVVCAGARNAGLVAGLLRAEKDESLGLKVWSHFEERSAGFFALGRTMAVEEPCAVVTTSGTAVAELLPAVIEAHYQGRPLVVISADRPERFRGTGAPQTIEQVGIFKDYVEGEKSETVGDFAGCFEGWSGRKPWHLNVEVEEDDVSGELGEIGEPDEVQLGRNKFTVSDLVSFLRDDVYKGMVVMVGGLREDEREEVWHFLRDLKAPVIADATSGLREALGGLILKDGGACFKKRAPGKILRLGEVPVCRLWRDLETMPEVEVFSICQTGYSGLARASQVIGAEVNRVLKGLGEVEEVGDVWDWLKSNGRAAAQVEELLQCFPESEPAMFRLLSIFASTGESVYLGNSLPIRLWNEYGQREVAMTGVRANRGANGIDGQVSTWLGASAEEEGTWGIFGDLTSLYDLAGPAMLEQVNQAGRMLVVVNNGGGKIFERLPRLKGYSEEEMAVVTNKHGHSFEGWAMLWGMDYLKITCADDFDSIEQGEEGEFVQKTTLVELVPDAAETKAFWEALEKM